MKTYSDTQSQSSPMPSPMTVYDGAKALGEIEDHGREGVRAFLGTGEEERKPLGTTYPDRKVAMRAVSDAARATQAHP
jgi:hypothetical protein